MSRGDFPPVTENAGFRLIKTRPSSLRCDPIKGVCCWWSPLKDNLKWPLFCCQLYGSKENLIQVAMINKQTFFEVVELKYFSGFVAFASYDNFCFCVT